MKLNPYSVQKRICLLLKAKKLKRENDYIYVTMSKCLTKRRNRKKQARHTSVPRGR